MRISNALVALLLLADAAEAGELTGTLQKIRDTNRIVIGFQEASIPFSYLDSNQVAIGYTLDICQKVVDMVKEQLDLLSLKIEFTPVTSSNRIPLLLNDRSTSTAHRQRTTSNGRSSACARARRVL